MKITLKTPFKKDGVIVTELTLNLDSLTGHDILAAEAEARMRGETSPNPLFSSLGNAIIAARACGYISDDIIGLSVQDFLMITTLVSNFLYGWVLPSLMPLEISEQSS